MDRLEVWRKWNNWGGENLGLSYFVELTEKSGMISLNSYYEHSLPVYIDSISKSLLWFAKDFDLDLFLKFEVKLSRVAALVITNVWEIWISSV